MNQHPYFAFTCIVLLAVVAELAAAVPYTMPPNPIPYTEINADGSITPPIRLLGHGESGGYNETFEVTIDGYTVHRVRRSYVYMEFDDRFGGSMISSGLVAGRDNPKQAKSKWSGKKLSKNQHKRILPIIATRAKNLNNRARMLKNRLQHLITLGSIEEANGIPYEQSHDVGNRNRHRRAAVVVGNKINLMVPFKFSDHANRVVPSTADLNVLMNNSGPHPLCPTGSVRDVFLASSYSQLVLDTLIAPWVILPNTEAYYAAGNSGLGTMAHIMIRDALNALQASGFNFSNEFDTNCDGYMDAIGFLHSGYGAEWGGTDMYGTAYANRIWSHKWAVYSLPGAKWTSTSGKIVYNYHISPSVWGTSGSTIGRIGVIAHETGHFFGLPDLYDGSVGSGIGAFCLMSDAWGFDGTQSYPPHMSVWSKIQLGWVTSKLIATSGTYTARQACTYPDAFQISANFPSGEFLLIENRQSCKFDAKIAGPGLAIFHIDESASFTSEGYPGQTGWPVNGGHYRVALLQADGTYDLERGVNRGDATDLFFDGGVNGISSNGTTTGATYPNTNAYMGGIVKDTGISIANISQSSGAISFVVMFSTLKPIASKPLTDKPNSSAPVTAKPITSKPITGKPATAMPVTVKPITTKPVTSKPVLLQPTTKKPLNATPITAKVVSLKPIFVTPVAPIKPLAPVRKPTIPIPKPVVPVRKPTATIPKPVAPFPKQICVATAGTCTIGSACCSKICNKYKKCA